MAQRQLLFLEPTTSISFPGSTPFRCDTTDVAGFRNLKVGNYGEFDNFYVFCMTKEEAKANHGRYQQGVLTYKEIPVVRNAKHIDIVYKDQTMQRFKSHLGEIGDLDYPAMAAALAAEERKTTDTIVRQVMAGIQQPIMDYNKLASVLASYERKKTAEIIDDVIAGIQGPEIDYGKLASIFTVEEEKRTEKIISKVITGIQAPLIDYQTLAANLAHEVRNTSDQIVNKVIVGVPPLTIDYDKLVVAFDRSSDSAAVDASQDLNLIIAILVSLLAAIVSRIMAVKEHREEGKKRKGRYEKLKKWTVSGDKHDTGLREKKTEVIAIKEMSGGSCEDDEDDEDDKNQDDSEVKVTTTAETLKSVPSFTEYVHGKAKSHPSFLEKAKVVDDDLSGFRNPAERELVEDMLLDAMLDIMEHGDRVSLQYRESLRAPKFRKRGLDLVDKICEKGKQYTNKAKRVAGVAGVDKTMPGLERKYKETLDKGLSYRPL